MDRLKIRKNMFLELRVEKTENQNFSGRQEFRSDPSPVITTAVSNVQSRKQVLLTSRTMEMSRALHLGDLSSSSATGWLCNPN